MSVPFYCSWKQKRTRVFWFFRGINKEWRLLVVSLFINFEDILYIHLLFPIVNPLMLSGGIGKQHRSVMGQSWTYLELVYILWTHQYFLWSILDKCDISTLCRNTWLKSHFEILWIILVTHSALYYGILTMNFAIQLGKCKLWKVRLIISRMGFNTFPSDTGT